MSMEIFYMCGTEKVCNATKDRRCTQCAHTPQTSAQCMGTGFRCDNCIINQCETKAKSVCFETILRNPVEIAAHLVKAPFMPNHGVAYHFVVGASLLAAYKNCGGKIDLPQILNLMLGYGKRLASSEYTIWSNLGLGITVGIFINLIAQTNAFNEDGRKLSSHLTARYLEAVTCEGGATCCRANALVAIREAAAFTDEILGVKMEMPQTLECAALLEGCDPETCRFYPQSAVVPQDAAGDAQSRDADVKLETAASQGPLS